MKPRWDKSLFWPCFHKLVQIMGERSWAHLLWKPALRRLRGADFVLHTLKFLKWEKVQTFCIYLLINIPFSEHLSATDDHKSTSDSCLDRPYDAALHSNNLINAATRTHHRWPGAVRCFIWIVFPGGLWIFKTAKQKQPCLGQTGIRERNRRQRLLLAVTTVQVCNRLALTLQRGICLQTAVLFRCA